MMTHRDKGCVGFIIIGCSFGSRPLPLHNSQAKRWCRSLGYRCSCQQRRALRVGNLPATSLRPSARGPCVGHSGDVIFGGVNACIRKAIMMRTGAASGRFGRANLFVCRSSMDGTPALEFMRSLRPLVQWRPGILQFCR
jgi:hypothetical protein